MKKHFFAAVLLSFSCWFAEARTVNFHDTEVRVVVAEKKIWFVADEMAVLKFTVEIRNTQGNLVKSCEFTAKCADWSLDVQDLPAGEYEVYVEGKNVKRFQR